MMLSYSQSARFVRFLRAWALSLPMMMLWVVVFCASDTMMRWMLSHSLTIKSTLILRTGLTMASV